jgi:Cellulose or protein binding domain.
MKLSLALSTLAVLVAKTSAACWSESLGYPCCKANGPVYFTDSDGQWGIENNDWCGIQTADPNCWATSLGYPCCKNTNVVAYTDNSGKWGVENGDWCGIVSAQPAQPVQPTQPEQPSQPVVEPEPPKEEVPTYPYSLKNKPVPSAGCGKDGSVKTGSFNFKWSGGTRQVHIDLPQGYKNDNPYRLIFGMQCMGGSGLNVRNEQYYGLKPLDTQGTTIFVAPEGNGQQLPWGQADYTLFDELLEHLKNNLCIDESRVFSTGFSYGSMFTNGLSWNHQKVLRGVAVYETAERNIWLPKHSGEPIAWMGVLGLDDGLCTPEMGRHARDIILEHNSEGGKAVNEKAEEAPRNSPHKCYDYKTVDPRFPVRWCTQSGGHIWDHKDPGQNQSWVPKTTWESPPD